MSIYVNIRLQYKYFDCVIEFKAYIILEENCYGL